MLDVLLIDGFAINPFITIDFADARVSSGIIYFVFMIGEYPSLPSWPGHQQTTQLLAF